MLVAATEKLSRFYRSEIRLSLKIIATSLVAGVIGVTPLLLFAVFGAADANPFGFGMLAIVGVLLAQLGLVAGLLRLGWELLFA